MSMARKDLIPWTARFEDLSESLVGGKAWNLFRLQNVEFTPCRGGG